MKKSFRGTTACRTVIVFLLLFANQLFSQTKSLYVDGLKNIIGNDDKEKELLEFARDSGYTYLLFYNINYIHKNLFDITDTATSGPLRDFLVKAKTQYGVEKTAVIGETYAPFVTFHDYNMDHLSDSNARFDVYNLEFEFWNSGSTGPGGYYCTTYLQPNGFDCDTAGAFAFILPELKKIDSLCNLYPWLHSEIYIGHPTDLQCARLAKEVDRVLVHYYRSSDVYNNGNSIYNYAKHRPPALTDSVSNVHVMQIFSGEDSFMGSWLETHPESQAYDTWMNGQNGFVADTGNWKNKISIDGYVWFKYTAMHDTALSLLAVNYYVSTSGDDNNPGTFTLPWRTIQKAANTATAGSTVFIMGGTYNENVVVNVSGTSGNVITFQNYPGQTTILDGTGTAGNTLLTITDKSYLKFTGLAIKNKMVNDAQGVLIDGNSHHIEIINNKISEIHFSANPSDPATPSTNAQPLIVYGDDATNSIHDLVIDSNELLNCRTGFSEALSLDGNIDGFTISRNNVHDITNIGILAAGNYGVCSDPLLDQARNGTITNNTTYNCRSPYASSGGIYVDGGRDIVIEQNTTYQNQYGIEIGCEIPGGSTSDVIVRNNLIYNNRLTGIAFGGYDYPSGSGKVVSCTLVNNTFFKNDSLSDYNGEMAITYTENCNILNNIFSTTSQNIAMYLDVSPVNLSLNYNIYQCPGGASALEFDWNGTSYQGLPAFQAGTGQDANSQYGNPNFTQAVLPDPDLHIAPVSFAINNGDPTSDTSISGTADFDNYPRIANDTIENGAYEFYKIWTGNTSDDWNNPSNWSPPGVPTVSFDVVIPTAPANNPRIQSDSAFHVHSINLQQNAVIIVTSADTLIAGN